jgi:hypothetical protein
MEESKRKAYHDHSKISNVDNTLLESSTSEINQKNQQDQQQERRMSTQKWPSLENKSYDSQGRGNTWTRKSPDIIEEDKKEDSRPIIESRRQSHNQKIDQGAALNKKVRSVSACLPSNYLVVTKEDILEDGIPPTRMNLANILRNKGFELMRAVLITIY